MFRAKSLGLAYPDPWAELKTFRMLQAKLNLFFIQPTDHDENLHQYGTITRATFCICISAGTSLWLEKQLAVSLDALRESEKLQHSPVKLTVRPTLSGTSLQRVLILMEPYAWWESILRLHINTKPSAGDSIWMTNCNSAIHNQLCCETRMHAHACTHTHAHTLNLLGGAADESDWPNKPALD